MGSLKLGLYALTLELAAWGGGLRLASEASDQALAWYLLVHLFASFLLSACAALLLPVGSRRQRGLYRSTDATPPDREYGKNDGRWFFGRSVGRRD